MPNIKQNQKIIIGLTGNIASGKTAAEKIFQSHNIPIINADNIVKQLLQPGSTCYQKIYDYFTKHPKYKSNTQTLDKAQIKQIIFNNKSDKQFLENTLHPKVREILEEFANNFINSFRNNPQKTAKFCILSIPLLYDKKQYPYIDKIIYIDISKDNQIKRLKNRDNIDEKLALKIIDSQLSTKQRLELENMHFDFVINNNSDISSLKNQINNIINNI